MHLKEKSRACGYCSAGSGTEGRLVLRSSMDWMNCTAVVNCAHQYPASPLDTNALPKNEMYYMRE